jgi:hypothetical protein
MHRLTLLQGDVEVRRDSAGRTASAQVPFHATVTAPRLEDFGDFDVFSAEPPGVVLDRDDEDDSTLVAIGLSFTWAIEAAAGGNYAGALRWLRTVEESGYEWSPVVHARRRTWLAALAAETSLSDALTAVL